MVGKLHKKKLSEYTATSENGEQQQQKGSAEKSKSVDESAEEVGERANGNDSPDGDKGHKKGRSGITDSDVKSEKAEESKAAENEKNGVEDDGDTAAEKNKKKGKKRKIIERAGKKEKTLPVDPVVEVDTDESLDSDDDVTPLKKGNKAKGSPRSNARGSKGKHVKKAVKDAKADDKEYEVKDIVDHKVERGVSYFLVRWKGYTKDDDTWEPEETLSCPDLIEKFKKKAGSTPKKGVSSPKKGRGSAKEAKEAKEEDPNKEWEVDKIIDYAKEKNGRVFRIRWKGFGPKYDTWEPEENLNCDEIIEKFMKRMKSQENVTFKELREEPKKTKRLVNETLLRTAYHSPIGRKSKRSITKKRVYYGDIDD